MIASYIKHQNYNQNNYHTTEFKSNEDVWYEKLNELKLFFETNKILPSPIANDEKEKLLCIWLSN